MRPTQHPSNNAVLGAPPGVPLDECKALPITRIVWDQLEQHGVVSFWQPTPAELELLNAGGLVRLSVVGRTHPPVFIGVDGDGVMEFQAGR